MTNEHATTILSRQRTVSKVNNWVSISELGGGVLQHLVTLVFELHVKYILILFWSFNLKSDNLDIYVWTTNVDPRQGLLRYDKTVLLQDF